MTATPPPAGGYRVVSWAHGTTGIADECAPSLGGPLTVWAANDLLDRGYVVTATDYEGLGTPGRHPYIVGESEARGVIDSVRAARALLGSDVVSADYAVWGHSQGGHATMFVLHIADTWAPELHLEGVVAGAPPSQFDLVYQYLAASPFKYYLLMVAAGVNAAYATPRRRSRRSSTRPDRQGRPGRPGMWRLPRRPDGGPRRGVADGPAARRQLQPRLGTRCGAR